MGKRFHCNPLTGAIGECHAKGKCPFGTENHADTFEEIQEIADKIHQKILDRYKMSRGLEVSNFNGIIRINNQKDKEDFLKKLDSLNYSEYDKEHEDIEKLKNQIKSFDESCDVHFITKENYATRKHSAIPVALKEEIIGEEWIEEQKAADVKFGYYYDKKQEKVVYRNKKLSDDEEYQYRLSKDKVYKRAWNSIVEHYKDKDLEKNNLVKLRNIDGDRNPAIIYVTKTKTYDESNSDKKTRKEENNRVLSEFIVRSRNYKDVTKSGAIKFVFKDLDLVKNAKKLDPYNFIRELDGKTLRQKELDDSIKEAKEEDIENMCIGGERDLEYEKNVREADLRLDNDDDDDNPIDSAEIKRNVWRKYINKCRRTPLNNKRILTTAQGDHYFENGDYVSETYTEIIDEDKKSILFVEREK